MEADRWERIQELFHAASALDSDDQALYLEDACEGDDDLRREVEEFLHACGGETGVLGGAIESAAGTALGALTKVRSNDRAGAYKLIRSIGQGGMGAVYLAERADRQYEQQVAVKFVRTEFASPELLQRFRTERQILAKLNHPNIARMLDGGVNDAGVPYLVMEYVEGLPIDEYAKSRQLTVRERIALLRAVCSAVEYAHSNLVVHRDLKPSNILVTTSGVPKLLDFGLAKLLDSNEESAAITRPAERMMTLEYASPEQVRGEAVTTATDVYALGVVLYELLASQRPFPARNTSALELQRKICDTEPRPPSSIAADVRGAPRNELKGDLDNIALMALRKQADTRYRSVEQFSDDLLRYLQGFPVIASKGSVRYRASKFARRHALGVGIGAASAIVLIGFSIAMSLLAAKVAQERDVARRESSRAEQVSGFLANLFHASDPFRAKGDRVTARELLDQGFERVSRDLRTQPAVRAQILDTMAQAYQHLGIFDRAQVAFSEELKAEQQTYGRDSIPATRILRQLADIERQRGNLPNAEGHLRQALRIQQLLLPADASELSHTWNNLGLVLQSQGRAKEAVTLFSKAVGISERYPSDTAETLVMMSNLGAAIAATGDLDKGETVLREVLRRRRQLLGDSHPQTLRSMQRLGSLLRRKGSYGEAEQVLRAALDRSRQVLGDRHPDTLGTMSDLASVLQARGNIREAEPLYRTAIDAAEQTLGDTADSAAWRRDLASLLQQKKEYPEAARLYARALAICRAQFGPKSPREAELLSALGALYLKTGALTQAEQSFEEALAIRRQRLGQSHIQVANSLADLAGLRNRQRRRDEAEHLYRDALEIDRRTPGARMQTAAHLEGLASLLAGEGQRAAAKPLLREALALRNKVPDHGGDRVERH